jgi:hypothetical protein
MLQFINGICRKLVLTYLIADNALTNFFSKTIFRPKYYLTGKCLQCGQCCRQIYLRAGDDRMNSGFFDRLSVNWLKWAAGFNLLRIDKEDKFYVFSCNKQLSDGRCGDYKWRLPLCRNYPIMDNFKEPVFLPGCGFSARSR